MTIESPQAHRPLFDQPTMFANSPSGFADYASSPVTRDHSLHTDLRFPSSPNSLTMYDADTDFLPSSLGSVCSNASFVDTGQPVDDSFDLKPQFECTDNAFLHQCLQIAADSGIGDDSIGGVRSDPAWSPTEAGLMKMEDIFQVDQKDAIQGPTLAELNFDDSELSVYDDPVEKEAEQKRLVSGGSNLWQQAILSGMENTVSVPQVVCGGLKPPIVPKFTTCTVTNPTAMPIDMRINAPDNKPAPMASTSASHSTLPQSLYSVTAKLSLFSDGPAPVKIMSCPDNFGMNNSPIGCLKVPQPPQSVTFGMLSSLVPVPQAPLPPSLIAAGKFCAPSNTMLSMVLEQPEDNKSSLQSLLTDPLPAVTIKSEPVDIPISAPTPMWNPAAAAAAAAAAVAAKSPLSTCSSVGSSVGTLSASGSPLKSSKRARSPEMDVAVSAPAVTSMEQKWEEIKQFIYDEEQSREEQRLAELQLRQRLAAVMQPRQQQGATETPQRQQRPAENQQRHPRAIEIQQHHRQQPAVEEQVALTPPKRIKTEPKDPAFTVKDEVESDIEDVDSEAEDSDDGGESIAGRDNDDNSDAESDSQFSILDDGGSAKGPPRYFWMYNTQSKGPKGKRLCKAVSTDDPYTLGDFEDPVFDPELNQTQYKHNGKARRGDGNDITPNPQKLYALGSELKKLNCTINDLTPVSELPSVARSKSRKEKNKLASRACRLKKKAQNEANKVKLYGLEREHHDLLTVLSEIRENMFKVVRTREPPADDDVLSPKLERLMKVHLTHMIAGHTADYVNSVLAKVVAGDPKGGLPL